ncbi:hypothetical protein [Vulcanisaeta distributa]|uniref:Uncharacterized protein n=1 Tax=Vulcanisaeta distributa (strain DSM 14429 / JCM 11212 / NBRC 100878 / IC-017) TaxID=572478 RepID=E1QSP4_VULDI|nr:hypothetical protein [Vulcanisaeta distributa]ADN49561.1 hypothetical protein Vdis_0148 [Vulcanisaeta distributa DSM 14429]
MKSGITSVTTAVIVALAIIAVTGLIAISVSLGKSMIDRARWAGLMGSYEPPKPVTQVGGNGPVLDGYCLVYTVNNGYYNITYYSCPSIPMNNTVVSSQ